VAAVIAVASKFVFRVRGKHVLNPTNGAIVILLMLGAPIWVSPGQWGNVAFFGFLMACLGGLVVNRAARSDVALAFVGFYLAILFARAFWLGQRMAIPQHQLESGALLLFAFFMISDPKTTPNARGARLVFGALVAAAAFYLQFVLYRPSGGLILALFALSPLVPVFDLVWPGPRYEWPGGSKGARHASDLPGVAGLRPALAPGRSA
jgi:Na+-transporting NADH:ubiquinone oxidoreductase subunit NqrB